MIRVIRRVNLSSGKINGVFAPAELYDMAAMQAARTDAAYFKAFEPGPDGAPTKLGPPRSMPSRS